MKSRNLSVGVVGPLLIFGCFFSGLKGWAADVFQWRGENRSGIYYEKGLLTAWPKEGPKLLWHAEGVGDGYASPVVVKGHVYMTGQKSGEEHLSAFNLAGKFLWSIKYGKGDTGRFDGARTAPTIVDGKAYVISAVGDISCIDLTAKKIVWSLNGEKSFGAEAGHWSTAESPLVYDGKVIYTAGGAKTTVVALNQDNGQVIWKSPSLQDTGAFVSPLLIEYNKKKQIIAVTATYIMGVNPDSGKIEWTVDYVKQGNPSKRPQLNTNTPIFHNGRIFVTSGYDHGGLMLELAKDLSKVKVLRKIPDLDTHHGGVVLVDGYLYGSNWLNNKKGNWVAINWETGEKKYEVTWGGKGAIISAEGMLYLYEELRGNLGLAKATPDGLTIISSFKITHGANQHWSHPVISDGRLYLRRGKVLMSFDIKAKK